jgi:hypothetical protein
MKEVCGNCKYNKRDFSKPQGYIEFCCGNENSEEYGIPTFFDDTCDAWEDKECTESR